MAIGKQKLFSDDSVVEGAKFGNLTVLGFRKVKYPSGGTAIKVKYQCKCGKVSETTRHNITHGQQGCGCEERKNHIIHGYRRRGCDLRLSQIFNAINQRCNNPNNTHYALYGGRGIRNEWNSFKEFVDDMSASYEEHVNKYGRNNTSIDRIDVNGNYCKDNCRWATQEEQLNNTRNNVFVDIGGERITPKKLANLCGIDNTAASARIKKFKNGIIGEAELKHIGQLCYPPVKVVINGIEYTARDIANMCGIGESSARNRINRYKEGKALESDLFYMGTKPVKERYISQGRKGNFNIK